MESIGAITESTLGSNWLDPLGKPAEVGESQTERTEHCEKHGEFLSKIVGAGKPWAFWTGCEACHEEQYLEQERISREARRIEHIERLTKALGIPLRFKGKTLETFLPETDDQVQVLQQAREYVADIHDNLATGKCLILVGPPGTGKTHIACGMLYVAVAEQKSGRFATVSEVIRDLRSTWSRDSNVSEGDMLDRYVSPRLLVLDEVGCSFGSEAEKVQIFNVLNERYNAMRPTIVISNLDINGLKEYLGERVIDRMRENEGRILVFKGQSWRGRGIVSTPVEEERALSAYELTQRELRAPMSPSITNPGFKPPRKLPAHLYQEQ